MDLHPYQSFGDYWNQVANQLSGAFDLHLSESCGFNRVVSTQTLPTFNGEFSLSIFHWDNPVLSQEAKEYYGRPFDQMEPEYKEFMKKYFLAQVNFKEN